MQVALDGTTRPAAPLAGGFAHSAAQSQASASTCAALVDLRRSAGVVTVHVHSQQPIVWWVTPADQIVASVGRLANYSLHTPAVFTGVKAGVDAKAE